MFGRINVESPWVKCMACLCPVFLSVQSHAGGFVGEGEIEHVFQRDCADGRGLEIRLKTSHANPEQCSNSIALELPCDHPGYKAMVTMSLSAFLQEKKVDFWAIGCDVDGQSLINQMKVFN